MSVPEHFADCFNYYLFKGEQIIKPGNLQPLDPTEIAIIPEDATDETVEKIRDLLKQCILMQDEKATYLLLGIENQSEIHYALPVKNMNYDAFNYGKQVSDIAKEHRKKKDIKNSREFLSGFTKEDKLKPIITHIAVSDDKKALEQLQHDDGFKSIDVDSVRLLNEFTNSKIAIQGGEKKMDMCRGLKELLEDRREEGIGLGANKKLREQVEKKIKKGYSVVEMADMLEEDEETITSLVKEIQLCTNN